MPNDKTSLVELLSGLGISRTEALTYHALLQLDSVSIRKIATRSGINRGTTYEALKRLLTLGLVSGKKRSSREYYIAESPEKIFDIIREKRRDLLDADTLAKKVVPDLTARQAGSGGQPLVRYYEGDEGVATILRDVLQTCRNLPDREYCAYSASHVRQSLYRKFPQFTARRVAESIKVRVIAVGEGGELAEYAERRWLPGTSSSPASSYTIVYGTKVAMMAITANNTPYGVIIEDAGTASMQRLLFDQLWRFIDPGAKATE
ncbi:MAG: TrmB family transcriptional regulator [Candidatus Saccharimonadales bacterium]